MLATNSPVKLRLLSLLDELVSHDGYGSLKVEIRLLRRGQKEIIIDAGKQYRYVVDFLPKTAAEQADNGLHADTNIDVAHHRDASKN